MKNIILTLSLFLGTCIYSMDQEPFISSSSSPSTHSADQEALTFEQMQKNEEESKGSQDQDSQAASTPEVDHEADWYCQCKFPRTNNELSWLNTAKSLVGAKQANYDNIQPCELDNKKLGVLYRVTITGKFCTIRILDTNSSKCLYNINPLQDEKDFELMPTQLCRLPENRMACILNSSLGKDKKIKIYDINSGKLLKDITVEGKYVENDGKYREYDVFDIHGTYLTGNRMALSRQCSASSSAFILILDLNSGKILKKIDLLDFKFVKKFINEKEIISAKYIDIFNNICSPSGPMINDPLAFSDGSLLLRDYYNVCIVSIESGEVENIHRDNNYYGVMDAIIFPNNEWLSMHKNNIKIWNNEKFKFKKIQEILNSDKLVISDLQNIILDYLSKEWNSKIVAEFSFFANDSVSSYTSFILNKDSILIKKMYHNSSEDIFFYILNVKTGKTKKEEALSKASRSKVSRPYLDVIDEGNKIVLSYIDGSMEIWTNQPKKEVQDSCVIC